MSRVPSLSSPFLLGFDEVERALGRVAKAAYLGTHMEYTVSTPVGELFVVDRLVTRAAGAGTPVWVSFEDHGVTVVP